MKPALAGRAREPVPYRVYLLPQSSPNTIVQCAVGAATTLFFEDETPVRIVAGLHEQLGIGESDKAAPDRLMYLRPTLSLAGLTTNVVVETDKGRASFFVKTVFVPEGAGPGDFTGEVVIRTKGAAETRERIETQLADLRAQVQQATGAAQAAEAARRQAEAQVGQAEAAGVVRGRAQVLAGLANMPTRPNKGRVIAANNYRLQQLARLDTEGATWVVYEISNRSKQPCRIEDVSIGQGIAEMYAATRELLPRQTVRVGVYVAGASADEPLIFNLSGTPIRAEITRNR